MKQNIFTLLCCLVLLSIQHSKNINTQNNKTPQSVSTATTQTLQNSFIAKQRKNMRINNIQILYRLTKKTAESIATAIHKVRHSTYTQKQAFNDILTAVTKEAEALEKNGHTKQAHTTKALTNKKSTFYQDMKLILSHAQKEQTLAWYQYLYPNYWQVSGRILKDLITFLLSDTRNISLADKTDKALEQFLKDNDAEGFDALGISKKDELQLEKMLTSF